MILLIVGAAAVVVVVAIAVALEMAGGHRGSAGPLWRKAAPRHAAPRDHDDDEDEDDGGDYFAMPRPAGIACEPPPEFFAAPTLPPIAGRPVTRPRAGHAHSNGSVLAPALLPAILTARYFAHALNCLTEYQHATAAATAATDKAAAEFHWLRPGQFSLNDLAWPTDSACLRAITDTDTRETVGLA